MLKLIKKKDIVFASETILFSGIDFEEELAQSTSNTTGNNRRGLS